MGVKQMGCKLSSFTKEELIQELMDNHQASFILFGPVEVGNPDTQFFYPVLPDKGEDDEWLAGQIKKIAAYLDETADLFTKGVSPSCQTCGWYGFQYQEGTCPVCGHPLM